MSDDATGQTSPTCPAAPPRVLVVGGTGAFGKRLVDGLVATTAFDVVVAGRDQARLATLASGGRVTVLRLDATRASATDLVATGAFAVANLAGPYQAHDFGLARAAIAAGLHYVDLADGRGFVAGFGALDPAARAARVVALTGASSTPALSQAALDHLTQGWRRVDRVEIAIAPGNRAPRGLAVMRSILGYVGRPVRVFEGGRWRDRSGWGMTVRRTLPGLGPRLLSLAETPDLDIAVERFRVTDTVLFRAGLELPILHLGLLLASLPVRVGALRSLLPTARAFRALAATVERLGSDRGGMGVEVTGLDAAGIASRATWSLVAEAGDGPVIPTLPMLAVLRALASGRLERPGASACVGVLSLADIEAEFRPYRIASAVRVETAPPSLYERVLGNRFALLPMALQRLHRPGWGLLARGMAQVDGAHGPLAKAIAALIGFPRAGEAVAVTVSMRPDGAGRERWIRDFAGRRFASTLSASRHGVTERFGPFTFDLDLCVGGEGALSMPVRAWRVFAIPLPRALAPQSRASEVVDAAGRFYFDIEVGLPLRLGRLVRYRGWLAVVSAEDIRAPRDRGCVSDTQAASSDR